MDKFKVVAFKTLSEDIQKIVKAAVKIREQAYCPYSNFAVGAAILTDEGKVYSGFNIENVAFSPTICAERAALPMAVCDGQRHVKSIAVVANQQNSFTAPCGVCRQTLIEFRGKNGDIDIYLAKPDMDKVLCTKLSEILPLSFSDFKDGISKK